MAITACKSQIKILIKSSISFNILQLILHVFRFRLQNYYTKLLKLVSVKKKMQKKSGFALFWFSERAKPYCLVFRVRHFVPPQMVYHLPIS